MNDALKPYNTFGIEAHADNIVIAESAEQLLHAWQDAKAKKQPVLLLGEGSNVLFMNDFSGLVIINRIKGITITEQEGSWLIHAAAGENWHQLVEYTLSHNMPGLENLAMIPGCVGSAPIQNIGAYGVEFERVCQYVDCINLHTGETERFTREACQFGYRESIFKHKDYAEYAIIAVGLCLPVNWMPVLTYGELARLDPASVTGRQIFDLVCRTRKSKLPDPRQQGNAGSFFKNPVITSSQAERLLIRYPSMPQYPQADGRVKLAAGWLIDQCQLKGFRIGDAAVHQQQALVIVNLQHATGKDIVALAADIRRQVGGAFDIWLEPEVRFIGAHGEVSALENIA